MGRYQTSFMGLETPLIQLKNPGIISIPLGFLAVIVRFAAVSRPVAPRAMWNEVYVRQNIGLVVSKSTAQH